MMMRHGGASWLAAAIVATAWTLMVSPPARAGYDWAGTGIQEITSGTVANGALYQQTLSLWSGQTATQSGGYSFDFTTPAVSDVVTARLLVAIYGGAASNTCNFVATMNGGTLASIVLGGTNDSNPEFTANQTNVYGSASSGAWLVSIPVTGNLTASGGTDAVNIAATTTSNFDGRIVYASLWEVYQNPSLSNQFQYAVGEGNGDIYNSLPNNAPGGVTTSASRLLDLGGVNASDAQAASLATLYDYVHSAQDNKLFLSDATGDDNTLLGGDPAVSSAGTYAAATASFALTAGGLSSSDNWFKFSVDPNDGVALSSGGYGSNVLRPQLAILEVTSPVPEPATICLLAGCLPALAIATIRRRKATSA